MTKEERERLEDAVIEEIYRHGCTSMSDEDLETIAKVLGLA